MPVTKSAIKALRRTKAKTAVNDLVRARARNLTKAVRKSLDGDMLPEMYTALDRAAKRRVIHPNKAARLKSRITKQVQQAQQASATAPSAKTSAKALPKASKKTAAAKMTKKAKVTKKTAKSKK